MAHGPIVCFLQNPLSPIKDIYYIILYVCHFFLIDVVPLSPIGLPPWAQLGSQNGIKIIQKCINFPSSFSSRFFFSFGRFFCCFSRCPTLDLIAIYSTFVGCAIFHKVRKSTKKDIQKPSKMTPKMQPKASKNASKNEAKK